MGSHLPQNYTTHEELVAAASAKGLASVGTELIAYDMDAGYAIVQATANGERGRYSGLGDCTKANVNRGIAPHFIRMAETRAVNRALRLYLGQGMVSIEELSEGRPPVEPAPADKPKHPSFDKNERGRWFARLAELGADYEAIKELPICVKNGKPSTWPTAWRDKLLAKLESGEVTL